MPCIDASGQVSESGKKILAAMANPVTLEEVAQQTGLPLYQVRSAAREILQAKLVEEKNGVYTVTAAGRSLLEAQS